MKTTIEMHGFEIVVEETDGVVSVSASKEGEVVEEFTLDLEDGEESEGGEDGEEIKGFEEFGQGEEEDFDAEEGSEDSDEDMDSEGSEDSDEDEDLEVEAQEEEEEDEDEAQLESFQSFINSSKRKVATKKVAPKKRK
jgi:hypothetical protein